MHSMKCIIFACLLVTFVILAIQQVQAGDDKGSTIILGVPNGGGFGGFGGGPNVISSGDKKGDTIIIGPQW